LKIRHLILIAGPAGAGKTYLASKIEHSNIFESTCVICADWYLHRGLDNYDLPESVDLVRLSHDLHRLERGDKINISYRDHSGEGSQDLMWSETLVIEGLYALSYEALRRKDHLSIYVATSQYLAGARRALRDVMAYNDSAEVAIARIEAVVVPAIAASVEPQKFDADIVYRGEEDWPLLVEKLRGLRLSERSLEE
jgi:uridine kinase